LFNPRFFHEPDEQIFDHLGVREQQLVAIVVLGCHGNSCLIAGQSTRIDLRRLLDQIPGTNGTPQQSVRVQDVHQMLIFTQTPISRSPREDNLELLL
jgi:hypothetical protein